MATSSQASPLLSPTTSNTSSANGNPSSEHEQGESQNLENGVAGRLYVSHLLSTCNSRVFEFGSVLYLAAIFPGTLMPMSVYAMARGASAIVLSSFVGKYIDTKDRLHVVRLSIVLQRVVVAASCCLFFLMAQGTLNSISTKWPAFAVLVVMACVEKLMSIMNLVAVEKDWVIVAAGGNTRALRVMNSQMRRIDLCCKLFGPFSIGLLDGFSTKIAILANLGLNVSSIGIEYFAIAQVYHRLPALREPHAGTQIEEEAEEEVDHHSSRHSAIAAAVSLLAQMGRDAKRYLSHSAFIPSFSCAMLYLTVLSFSGQMVTYLLSSGYTSAQVSVARTVSVAFEVLATWFGPWLMEKIGPVRGALWFASWQVGCLTLGISVFLAFADAPLVSASGLVVGTILSRVGLWGFDLCTQILVQEEVEPEMRGAFSAVEAAWQNLFEMSSYASTIILSSPDQFKWPASMSAFAVAAAWALYTRFVVQRRGHLIHWPDCLASLDKSRARSRDQVSRIMDRRTRREF